MSSLILKIVFVLTYLLLFHPVFLIADDLILYVDVKNPIETKSSENNQRTNQNIVLSTTIKKIEHLKIVLRGNKKKSPSPLTIVTLADGSRFPLLDDRQIRHGIVISKKDRGANLNNANSYFEKVRSAWRYLEHRQVSDCLHFLSQWADVEKKWNEDSKQNPKYDYRQWSFTNIKEKELFKQQQLVYEQSRSLLRNPPQKKTIAQCWQNRLGREYCASLTSSGFGVVIHDRSLESAVVQNLLDSWDQSFYFFLCWRILQGEPLKAPDEKLVVVFVEEEREFRSIQSQLPKLSWQTYPYARSLWYRPENTVLISRQSLSTQEIELKRMIQRFPIDHRLPLLKSDRISREDMQTISSLSEAGIRCGMLKLIAYLLHQQDQRKMLSHQAFLQFFQMVDSLPNHGFIPNWLMLGLGSLGEWPCCQMEAMQEKAREPGQEKSVSGKPQIRFWFKDQLGKANPRFADRFEAILLENDYSAVEMLLSVIVDQPGILRQKNSILSEKGIAGEFATDNFGSSSLQKESINLDHQALAWSLVLYLVYEKPDDFRYYCQRLAKLPRDMELNSKNKIDLFMSSFCESNDDLVVNTKNLKSFAYYWIEYGKQLRTPCIILEFQDKKRPRFSSGQTRLGSSDYGLASGNLVLTGSNLINSGSNLNNSGFNNAGGGLMSGQADPPDI